MIKIPNRILNYAVGIKVDNTERVAIDKDKITPRLDVAKITEFRLTLTNKTHLHVGSGKKELDHQANLVKHLHYRNGYNVPVIPGSSMKGYLSTAYHALTGSAEKTSLLFGTTRGTAIISKVFCRDATPINSVTMEWVDMDDAWKPKRGRRDEIKIYDRKRGFGRTIAQLEAFPPKTKFHSRIVLYSNKADDIAGILTSLGYVLQDPTNKDSPLISRGFLLGYAKPLERGLLKLVPEESYIGIVSVSLKPETKWYKITAFDKYVRKFITNKLNPNENPKQLLDALFR